MKFWCFDKGFGLENLVLREGSLPRPGPRDVLLQMRAASLNYRDLVVMRGQHGRAVQPPLIPLSDGVGTVIARGEQVADLAVGDRVAPGFYQHWQDGAPPADLARGRLGGPLDGVLATHRVFPADAVIPVPEHLSDAEAASLPCAGVTAWSALSEPAPLRPGETVVIQGSGGVALIALQLAKIMGARAIMTTSGPAKAKRLTALGADEVIDRSATPDWAREVRALTCGTGADRILELGGAASLKDAIKAVRTGGKVLLIGNVTGNLAEISLPEILTRRITLHSVSCGALGTFRALCRALDYHRLRPVIGREIAFEQAPTAFTALENSDVFGKICVSCETGSAS